jgi:hypothetical protein
MNKKYDNSNIIIASRAYFLQIKLIRARGSGERQRGGRASGKRFVGTPVDFSPARGQR